MSPKEYTLLFYMIENEGIALTREQLIRDVWGYDFTEMTVPLIHISNCCVKAWENTVQ